MPYELDPGEGCQKEKGRKQNKNQKLICLKNIFRYWVIMEEEIQSRTINALIEELKKLEKSVQVHRWKEQ